MNKIKSVLFAAGISLALVFTFSCSSDDSGGSGTSSPCPNAVTGDGTMSCGGQTYRTVEIGSQTWMAENLNYDVKGSKCYDNDQANCDTYGRLYSWAMAMGIDAKYNREEWGGSDVKHQGICPDGWHLPSVAEWNALITEVGDESTAGKYLKTKTGWNRPKDGGVPGNGTDYYGFSALPGGFGGDSNAFFHGVGDDGFWWSSTEYEYDSNEAYRMGMDHRHEGASTINRSKEGYSMNIRCLQD